MAINTITMGEPRRNNHGIMLPAAVGAVVGAASRYVVPTKAELTKMINKESVDSFVSSASINARSASRSILKYGGIGALIAGVGALLVNAFTPQAKAKHANEFSKYGVIIDAPVDSAYALYWYEDSQV